MTLCHTNLNLITTLMNPLLIDLAFFTAYQPFGGKAKIFF